jgi:hypothetical protein
MATPEEQEQSMIANLERDSGKPIAWWLDLVEGSGLARHGERVAFLKADHGLGHGFANLVVHLARRRGDGEAAGAPDDLVETQYRGKEHLRPIYDAIREAVQGFGADVEFTPKMAGVSLRRSKQFALVEPATKTRVDVGINLKGEPPTGRLEIAGGMCTHRVRVGDVGEVDAELVDWLREAYERA